MRVLIGCIGNIFQGDDAFGCEVAQALSMRPLPSDVKVVDFGIRGLDLTFALMEEPELTILVDTVWRGGSPGTLYTIDPNIEAGPVEQNVLQTHSLDPLAALRAAQALGARLGRILLVGCEPADLGGEEGYMGLTPLVKDSVPRASAIVERLATQATPNPFSYAHSQA